jgi:hypothetical protein
VDRRRVGCRAAGRAPLGSSSVRVGANGRGVALRNYAKKMVGRDGIEPPTPGFSDRPASARKYAEALCLDDLAPSRSLVHIGSRWSITGIRGHRTGTPPRRGFDNITPATAKSGRLPHGILTFIQGNDPIACYPLAFSCPFTASAI